MKQTDYDRLATAWYLYLDGRVSWSQVQKVKAEVYGDA